jgi:hypothetical protein
MNRYPFQTSFICFKFLLRNTQKNQLVKKNDGFPSLTLDLLLYKIKRIYPIKREGLLEIYRKMLLVWTIGKTRNRILKEGRIQLNAHWGTGQEAVSVGVTGPLRHDDILFGMNRGVGDISAKE